MAIEFLEFGKGKPTHIVRVLSPLGTYPATTIINGDSALYVSEELCFSIVPNEYVEIEDGYSEVSWITINEIRLYASVLLCVDRSCGYSSFYPFNVSKFVRIRKGESIESFFDCIAAQLIKDIKAPPQKIPNTDNHFRTNSYTTSKIVLPFSCGGDKYDLRPKGFNFDLENALFNSFDTKDYLMVRGVSTLLRSKMLASHHHFFEEAINTTFISLEASFRLVLRRLTEMGVKNPSSKDASEFIGSVFNSRFPEKYFEEYYESRVKSFHPESRYGTFPHAPLMVDDHYDLFDDLLGVYCYLISGYVYIRNSNCYW